jgi:phage shock protein E
MSRFLSLSSRSTLRGILLSATLLAPWTASGGILVSDNQRHEADHGARTLTLAAASAEKPATVIKNVDAKTAAKLLSADTNIVVIDVRTPEEFTAGHIAGATNVNFKGGQFPAAVEKLDREKTYLVHCAVGGRSKRSLEVFKNLGFKSIVHLDDGLKGWEAAGKPVVK